MHLNVRGPHMRDETPLNCIFLQRYAGYRMEGDTIPAVLSMTDATAGSDTKRCRHCSTAMYCRASGVSGGGALADGPTGEGSSPSRLVIQAPASSARVPTDTPALSSLILMQFFLTKTALRHIVLHGLAAFGISGDFVIQTLEGTLVGTF